MLEVAVKRKMPLSFQSLAAKPKIYIVGKGRRATEVFQLFESFKGVRVLLPDVATFIKQRDRRAMGVVLVGPMLGLNESIKQIQSTPVADPIETFVITTNEFDNSEVKELYSKGVAGVFAYPREKSLIRSTIEKILQGHARFKVKRANDLRMSKAIWARCQAAMGSMKQFQVWCHNGVVYCLGQVPSIRKKNKLERIVREAPGVENFLDFGIQLPDSPKVDRELEQHLSQAVKSTPGAMPETISFSAKQGKVVVTGNVKDKKTLRRLTEKFRNIFGVKAINNLVAVSSNRVRRDQKVANRIKNGLDQFFRKSRVQVSVMQNIAILTGRVDNFAKKKMVEELVQQYKPISRVINRVEVG